MIINHGDNLSRIVWRIKSNSKIIENIINPPSWNFFYLQVPMAPAPLLYLLPQQPLLQQQHPLPQQPLLPKQPLLSSPLLLKPPAPGIMWVPKTALVWWMSQVFLTICSKSWMVKDLEHNIWEKTNIFRSTVDVTSEYSFLFKIFEHICQNHGWWKILNAIFERKYIFRSTVDVTSEYSALPNLTGRALPRDIPLINRFF